MNSLVTRARTPRLLVVGAAVAAMGLAACVPPPEEPAPVTQIDFDSVTTSDVMIFIEGDEETPGVEVTPQFTGTAVGSWDLEDGSFGADLAFESGSFVVEANGTSVIISYDAQGGAATGSFDPDTGVGGLETAVDLTVTNIDLLGDIEQPCTVGIALDLEGQIDAETGVLDVAQEGFAVTAPAEGDCSGLGGIIGSLLGGPVNSWDLSFEVGTV